LHNAAIHGLPIAVATIAGASEVDHALIGVQGSDGAKSAPPPTTRPHLPSANDRICYRVSFWRLRQRGIWTLRGWHLLEFLKLSIIR
jgi:hypothetical protein